MGCLRVFTTAGTLAREICFLKESSFQHSDYFPVLYTGRHFEKTKQGMTVSSIIRPQSIIDIGIKFPHATLVIL